MKKITLFAIITGCALCANAASPDVNGDGEVNELDTKAIYDHILNTNSSITLEAADVDGNGEVNTLDVVEVYRAMTYNSGNPSIDATALSASEIASLITSTFADGTTDIDITLAANMSAEDFKTAIATPVSKAPTAINLTLRGITAIPDEYNAFRACSKIGTITLTDATSIGKNAFRQSSITEIYAPKVATAEQYAFAKCSSLTTAILPALTDVSNSMFHTCYALITTDFASVTSLDTSAFNNCHALTVLTLPKVSIIGASAFVTCKSLSEIVFNTPITSVGTGAFNETDTQQISLTLSADQKTMTGSTTTGWTASTSSYWDSADYTKKSFCGYTFKEILTAE